MARTRPWLENLEDRCVLDFAPASFLRTPFPDHETPLAEHFHPHVHILIDGTEHVIPGDTNIVEPDDPIVARGVAPGLYPIHVHMEDLQLDPPDIGKLHVESTLPYEFHLGDFFTIWSYTSGSEKVFNSHEIKMVDSDGHQIDFLADASHTISMTVDGQPNNDFENFVLSDPQSPLPDDPGPNIVITGTTLIQAPPPPAAPAGSPNQMLVSQYYEDCLGRAPDPQGLAHFSGLLDQGTASRSEVAQMIQTSAEARTRQVQTLFHKFLGRQADPVGLDLSTRFLGMGGSLVKLECVICSSPEYFVHNGSANDSFLTAAYRDVLGRPVDPVGRSLGGQALRAGMDRGKVAEVVFTSSEGIQSVIQGFYSELLHRSADSLGLNAYSVVLSQHLHQLGMPADESPAARSSVKVGMSEDDISKTIMSSDEYFARLQTRGHES